MMKLVKRNNTREDSLVLVAAISVGVPQTGYHAALGFVTFWHADTENLRK